MVFPMPAGEMPCHTVTEVLPHKRGLLLRYVATATSGNPIRVDLITEERRNIFPFLSEKMDNLGIAFTGILE